MKNRIREIITELKDVISIEDLNISDDVLFAESLSCYRGEQVGKSRHSNYSKQNPSQDKPVAVTENQLKYLKKHKTGLESLGFDLSSIKSKHGAHKIISEFIKLSNDKTKKTNNNNLL